MIITRQNKTTLTIDTSKDLYLEQIGGAEQRIKLTQGVNNIPVGAGVFRVLWTDTDKVSVTADALDVQITTTGDKDGTIDPLVGRDQPAPR